MKILYIIHDNKKGGAAVSFLEMIKGVSQQHQVFVITPHKKGYLPDELDKLDIQHKSAHYYWWQIFKVGNPLEDSIRFILYRFLNLYNYIEMVRISKFVEGMGVDIIHSNSGTINIGALVSVRTGKPHVWHLRELTVPEYPLYGVRKSDSPQKVLNTGNNIYIAISEYTKRFYSKYIDDPSRIQVVYNGISTSYNYMKDKREYGTDQVSFLISGNYSDEKGQIDVAHAVGMLVQEGVKNFKVYMAGRGDFVEVKEYLKQNGLEEYVMFCGLVEEMLILRKKCDVEIVASRTEAFGRVTVEAMRASNPVIGSATGGTAELIEDGVTGFLYKYKDNIALAACMRRFIDNPSLIAGMGRNAYEWAIDRFTSEENIEKILAVYDGVVRNCRK